MTFELICKSVKQYNSQVIKTPKNGKHIINYSCVNTYKEVTEVTLPALYYIEQSHFYKNYLSILLILSNGKYYITCIRINLKTNYKKLQ